MCVLLNAAAYTSRALPGALCGLNIWLAFPRGLKNPKKAQTGTCKGQEQNRALSFWHGGGYIVKINKLKTCLNWNDEASGGILYVNKSYCYESSRLLRRRS